MIWLDKARGSIAWRCSNALGMGLVALSLCTAASAFAQTKEELDKARTTFKEGVALMSANNCAAALTKFQAVANVKMTAQVAFNIAECEERLGKLVSALGNYRLAASLSEGDPKAKNVSSQVGARVDKLEVRVPKLIVKRGKGAETALIEFDGAELGAAKMSSEFPVDPGNHTIIARIGDKEYLHETVSLEEKELKTFEVKLDLPPPKLDNPDDQSSDKPKAPPDTGRSKVPGAVILGVGGVSAALGVVFMVLRGGTLSELKDQCGGDTDCPRSAEPIAEKGRLYTGLAEASFVVGGVGLITGIVLLATSGPSEPKQAPSPSALRKGGGGAAGQVVMTPSSPRDPQGAARWIELRPSAPGASIGGLSLVGRF
jgi:hypothetical protein